MLTKFSRFVWFLSSYTPLWLILIILNFPCNLRDKKSIFWVLFFLIITIISNNYVRIELKKIRILDNDEPNIIIVKKAKRINNVSVEYIITYAMSFITFDLYNLKGIISFILLISFFAYLYIKNNQIMYNPMLEICGYKFFEIEFIKENIGLPITDERKNKSRLLISKQYKVEHEKIYTAILGDDIFIEKQI